MKNLKILLATLAIIIGTQSIVCAIQTQNIETKKNINYDMAKQVNAGNVPSTLDYINKYYELAGRYKTNLRECVPFHLSQSLDLFGLKFSYNVDINGWVDNKCSYYATANVGGLGKDIREVFNIKQTDEQIQKIKPELKCDFTKEQLDIFVDALIASQERKLEQLNSDKNEKNVSYKRQKLTLQEEKFFEMLLSQQVCKILNKDELLEQFTNLSQPQL